MTLPPSFDITARSSTPVIRLCQQLLNAGHTYRLRHTLSQPTTAASMANTAAKTLSSTAHANPRQRSVRTLISISSHSVVIRLLVEPSASEGWSGA